MSVVCLCPSSAKYCMRLMAAVQEISRDVLHGSFSQVGSLSNLTSSSYTTNLTTSLWWVNEIPVTVTLEITNYQSLIVHQSPKHSMKSWFRLCQKAHTVPHSFETSLVDWFGGFSGSHWVLFLLHSISGALLLWPAEGRKSQNCCQEEAFPLHWSVCWCCDGKEGTGELLQLQLNLFPGSRLRDHICQTTGCRRTAAILAYQWADPEWWNIVVFKFQESRQVLEFTSTLKCYMCIWKNNSSFHLQVHSHGG